jgi:predicted O-methyltransferase YrrM
MSNDIEQNLTEIIDNYIQNLYTPQDEALEMALLNMSRDELPPINVSPNEGKLLYLLTKMTGAKKVLEIGTLGGYSTIWLARALPADGRVLTLEYSDKHAAVARHNIARAGLADRVEVRIGAGLDLLPQIAANGEGPFDLFFIDADKESYPGYLEWAIKLARPGSVILSDNLIRNGAVIDPDPTNRVTVAVARFNQELATNPRLESLILPIMRGHVDGLGLTIVKN